MADATGAAFFLEERRPRCPLGTTGYRMIEILFIYQLARNPLQAMARRWWCRSLFRATSGRRRCREGGES
jgi:hypothetical protein